MQTARARGLQETSKISRATYVDLYRLLYLELLGAEEYDQAECDDEVSASWGFVLGFVWAVGEASWVGLMEA